MFFSLILVYDLMLSVYGFCSWPLSFFIGFRIHGLGFIQSLGFDR